MHSTSDQLNHLKKNLQNKARKQRMSIILQTLRTLSLKRKLSSSMTWWEMEWSWIMLTPTRGNGSRYLIFRPGSFFRARITSIRSRVRIAVLAFAFLKRKCRTMAQINLSICGKRWSDKLNRRLYAAWPSVLSSRFVFSNSNYNYSNTNANCGSHRCDKPRHKPCQQLQKMTF